MRTLKVLFLISFWSTFICRIGAQVELSENTEVSILTIGPGAVLEDGGKKEGFICAKVDLEEVTKARQAIPSLISKKKYLTNF